MSKPYFVKAVTSKTWHVVDPGEHRTMCGTVSVPFDVSGSLNPGSGDSVCATCQRVERSRSDESEGAVSLYTLYGARPIYILWWCGEYGYDYDLVGVFTSQEYAEASVDDLNLYDIEEYWLYDRPKGEREDTLVW